MRIFQEGNHLPVLEQGSRACRLPGDGWAAGRSLRPPARTSSDLVRFIGLGGREEFRMKEALLPGPFRVKATLHRISVVVGETDTGMDHRHLYILSAAIPAGEEGSLEYRACSVASTFATHEELMTGERSRVEDAAWHLIVELAGLIDEMRHRVFRHSQQGVEVMADPPFQKMEIEARLSSDGIFILEAISERMIYHSRATPGLKKTWAALAGVPDDILKTFHRMFDTFQEGVKKAL